MNSLQSATDGFRQLPLHLLHTLLERACRPVLLHSARREPAGKTRSYLYAHPLKELSASQPADCPALLDELDRAQAEGLFAAGWLSWEFGHAILPETGPPAAWPEEDLAWFGLYRERLVFDHESGQFCDPIPDWAREALSACSLNATMTGPDGYGMRPCRPSITPADYHQAIGQIREGIREGCYYQVNQTFRCELALESGMTGVYAHCSGRQPVSHAAWLDNRRTRILSFSPELFFRTAGGRITVRPMKGTAPRGETPETDAALSRELAASPKNRAENAMIVDLLRNDLGRIARPGSVSVPCLFSVETHPTLHQMTSTVTALLRDDVSPGAIIRALFPCGSVAGAPKIRAMREIARLETTARGVYCGAIGHLAPGGDACFSVAIRTLVMQSPHAAAGSQATATGGLSAPLAVQTGSAGPDAVHRTDQPEPMDPAMPPILPKAKPAPITARFGIGSGIVYDSNTESEYDECLLKADFFCKPDPALRPGLIETMRADTAGIPGLGTGTHGSPLPLLEFHLDRLFTSAGRLGISPHDSRDALRRRLLDLAASLDLPARIRLALSPEGTLTISHQPLPQADTRNRVILSPWRLPGGTHLSGMKTDARQWYATFHAGLDPACDLDLVFANVHDEMVEGCISNLWIRRGTHLVTPPLSSGALAGVARRFLLETRSDCIEDRIPLEEFMAADGIWLSNAVIGLCRVYLAA